MHWFSFLSVEKKFKSIKLLSFQENIINVSCYFNFVYYKKIFQFDLHHVGNKFANPLQRNVAFFEKWSRFNLFNIFKEVLKKILVNIYYVYCENI